MPAPRTSIRPKARPTTSVSAPRRSIRPKARPTDTAERQAVRMQITGRREPMARPIDLTPRAEAGDQMFVRKKKGYNKGGYVNCGASVPGTQKK